MKAKPARDDEKILERAHKHFKLCADHESEERKEMVDDIKFARLSEQWPDAIRKQREAESRPCLTINRLPAFIRQVVNDARQNKPQIKVRPVDDGADPETADLISGLIRNIEYTSNADVAYDTAMECAVTCGKGYFRINTEYACDDTFDQDIIIERIANPLSVFGDPFSQAADSSDWNVAFVTEMMSRERFRSTYKGSEEVDWDALGYEGLEAPWREDEAIMVAEYWVREEVQGRAVLLSDGQVVSEEVMAERAADLAQAGLSVVGERPIKRHKVTQYLLTGAEVLEAVEWPGRYIPIVPVYGDEVNVEGKRYFRSLIRDVKDAQRMFNYWRTTATETVALAPKVPFIGPKGAFKTDRSKWETANSHSWDFIEYDGGIPPQRQPLPQIPAAAIQEALNASDDMKAILGIYDASLGARSNETSGRAIMARQREGDVSTFHFIDNETRAIRHAGRILIDLLPHVYSAERIIRTVGPEGDIETRPINQPVQEPVVENGQPVADEMGQPVMRERIYDLTAGKYDLVVEAGPSFTTRREEAAFQMTELIRAYPQAAPILGDLLAKNLDWPGADEIGDRLKALQQGGDPRAAQQLQELAAQVQELTQRLQQEQADKSIDAAKVEIDAFEAETARMKAVADLTRPPQVRAGTSRQAI